MKLRDFLVDTVARTGGHLAPNLGVVRRRWLFTSVLIHRRIRLSGTWVIRHIYIKF